MKVTAFVTDTVPIRAACLLQRSPEFFKKTIPLPGVSLALVGCNTDSLCVCVCVCVCVFIKLHITAQSGPVILVILCHSH